MDFSLNSLRGTLNTILEAMQATERSGYQFAELFVDRWITSCRPAVKYYYSEAIAQNMFNEGVRLANYDAEKLCQLLKKTPEELLEYLRDRLNRQQALFAYEVQVYPYEVHSTGEQTYVIVAPEHKP